MAQLDFEQETYDWSQVDLTQTGTGTVHLPENWEDQTNPYITDFMHLVDGEEIEITYGDNLCGEFRWYGGNQKSGSWWWHPDWILNATLPIPPLLQEEG